MSERVVLAYSGGLDTSVGIGWLKEATGKEVVALATKEELATFATKDELTDLITKFDNMVNVLSQLNDKINEAHTKIAALE